MSNNEQTGVPPVTVDNSGWYAYVKYFRYGDEELVSVKKIRKVVWSRDRKPLRTEAWDPQSLTDFDKNGYLYSVTSSRGTTENKDLSWYAMISRIEETREKLQESITDKRVQWPVKFQYTPNDSEPPSDDTSHEDELTPTMQQRIKATNRSKAVHKASVSAFEDYMKNAKESSESALIKRSNNDDPSSNFGPSHSKRLKVTPLSGNFCDNVTIMAASDQAQNGCSTASSSEEVELLRQENERLRSQLQLKNSERSQHEELKDIIHSFQHGIEAKIESVERKFNEKFLCMQESFEEFQNVSRTKFSEIATNLIEVIDTMSKSSPRDKFQFVNDWLNGLIY